jgi:hypothetical protein
MLDCVGSLLGVQWVYRAPEVESLVSPGAVDVVSSHARHHIDDLYQLGRIGHVRGIQAKLNELEAKDPASKPFATHLRKLVANFDLKSYMQALEVMRKNG